MSFIEVLKSIRLKVRNYKCFGEEPQGFDTLRPTNVIIGRNNSGKSALLDLVELACKHSGILEPLQHKAAAYEVNLTKKLTEQELRSVFREDLRGGSIGSNHWQFGKALIGTDITFEIGPKNKKTFKSIDAEIDSRILKDHSEALAASAQNWFENKAFRRLAADRDTTPESDTGDLKIDRNGTGFTNVIQRYLVKSNLPSELIERGLLTALNVVFSPDASFSDILVQQHGDGRWEIYLEERGKGRIALSHSGSGLKTVLLVLGFFILLPSIEKKPLSDFVFAFEELENNLHPALQRRLIKFIRDASLESGCLVFLTTHSSAVIDLLSNDEAAQIVHVTHDRIRAKARHVATYFDNRGILDDLDVRASDLLQANGIVWLEGPSDRLYFNRWIDLIAGGKLREGAQYQCVFYGGRLLAHLSGDEPFQEPHSDHLVKIFGVNRNAIVLMDSDRDSASAQIGETKKRIISEVEGFGGMTWVTDGREVENYIPHGSLQRLYPGLKKQLGQYENIKSFLEKVHVGEGKKFERSKVLFAERVAAEIREADLIPTREGGWRLPILSADPVGKIYQASQRIADWNGMKATWIPERVDCN